MTDERFFNSRRRFLSNALLAAPSLGLLGATGLSHVSPPEGDADSHYEPIYFTEQEWAFIVAAVDRLIPSDADGPGAVDLNVPVFIDRQMEDAYGHGGYWYMQGPFHPEAPPTLGYQLRFTPRELYRTGIAEIDAWCAHQHGKPFAQLDADTRDAVLHQLEQGAVELSSMPSAVFFNQLLQNTREGYFADPMYGGNKGMGAWKLIGFPGARADFTDWEDQQGKVYPLGPVSIKGSKA